MECHECSLVMHAVRTCSMHSHLAQITFLRRWRFDTFASCPPLHQHVIHVRVDAHSTVSRIDSARDRLGDNSMWHFSSN